MIKECIRRLFWAGIYLGLCDAEVVAISGTWKHSFYTWLYEDHFPLFDTQLPDADPNESK